MRSVHLLHLRVATRGTTREINRRIALNLIRTNQVRPGVAGCDIAEISAPVDQRYPVQFVPFADVQKDPGLHPDFKRTGSGLDAGKPK